VAATLEQKVWLTTSSRLYPNLYVFLVGHPGVGKTRTIRATKAYAQELPDFHFSPTSMTPASLVDALVDSKRNIIQLDLGNLEYNTMFVTADELGAFMHKYDNEMIGVLSAFYDTDPYGQHRRGKELKIKIKSPQLNILSGTTPSNLLNFMPENAWDQGFTSRIILVFSDERIVGDDFAVVAKPLSKELLHDLKQINSLSGQFAVTSAYRDAVNQWRAAGEPPVPSHPKLTHYITRRRTHLYKLSMVSAVDKSDELLLTKEDFDQALEWLCEAETYMPDVFRAGATGGDNKAMEEIHNFLFISDKGSGVHEHDVVKFTRERVPAHSVMRVLDIMKLSGSLVIASIDKRSGARMYRAGKDGDRDGTDQPVGRPPSGSDPSSIIP